MRDLALLLLLALVLLVPFLGREGLTDPDESAYAESVREMGDRGDWIVPSLYGQPLLDKPILIYWAIGASTRVLGLNEYAARLPSVLAALTVLLAVYRLGWRVYGDRRAGWTAAMVLASSLEFILLGRAAVTDMLLTAFCTLALLAYLEALARPSPGWLPLAGAACLGLAVLTKGPLGALIPIMVLGTYLAATRSLRRVADLRPVAGALVAAAVALPWYALLAVRRPGLVSQFIVQGNLGRFLNAEHRPEPVGYYLIVLLVGFLPWSVFVPGALGRTFLGARGGSERSRPLLLLAIWLGLPLLFFTVAASKLPSYILPVLPAAALLAAEPLRAWLGPLSEGRRIPGTGGMILLVLAAGGMVMFAWERRDYGSVPIAFKTALLPICIAGLLGTLFALTALIVQRPRVAFHFLLLGSTIMILALLTFGFPLLEPWKSSRPLVRAVAPDLRPSDRIVLYRLHHPGFAYYLGRVPELVRREEDLEARLHSEDRQVVLMARDKYEKLRARRPDLPLFLLTAAGQAVVVTNQSPGAER